MTTKPATEGTPVTLPATRPQQRLAELVTEVTAPAPTAALLLVAVALHSAGSVRAALGWGLLAAVFAALIPFGFIVVGVLRGRWSNHHVPQREHRRVPLTVGIVSVVVGLLVLSAGGAPRELLALVAAMLVGLTVTLLVTQVWKVSIHASVAAGTAAILLQVFGAAALPAIPAVAVIAWARTKTGDHTPAQVGAGCVLGALVAALVFPALR